jgi:YVTN family beta-propeller protein
MKRLLISVLSIVTVLNLGAQQLPPGALVSILNRTARVRDDGTWISPNVPANFGAVRARANYVLDGVTYFAQSDIFSIPSGGIVTISPMVLGSVPIPRSLLITTPAQILTREGETLQLTVIATFSDNSTKNATAAAEGTSYTISSSATATINPDGLVTAKASGTVVISAINDGAIGMIQLRVQLTGDSDGDGIPDDLEIANGLNPNNPVDAEEDADGDGLTNKQELLDYGTNMRVADTDGDGISDGDEVTGKLGFATNPLLADTDGDGIRDKLEIQSGSDPTKANSYNLAQALQSFNVTPASFVLTMNTIIGEASRQLTVTGHLKDGTTINLTSTTRGTTYNSSDLFIANFGSPDGRIFAGNNGTATITVANSGFSGTATVIVKTFTPSPLAFVDIPGFANNVDVNGNYAYVAAGLTGLQVVDVSNRSAPVIVASRDTPGNANDVQVVGNLAFIADGPAGLEIIDISNPLTPAIVGSLDTPGDASDVAVSGTRAYIADGSAGLKIIDVSSPATPFLLGSVDTPGTAKGVALSGNLAVVADGNAGIQIVDISNPSQPTVIGTTSTGGDARDVAVDDNFAYVADFSRSFTVIDITNPSNPIIRSSTPQSTGGLLQDVVIAGRFAFGADVFFVNGVPIIDISTPGSPVPRAILNFAGFRDDNGTGIAVDNQYVYLTAERGTISENGVNGQTRLYIGRYQAIEDTAGISPTVAITSPLPGPPLIEGSQVVIQANASDDIAVAAVIFFLNGEEVFTDTTGPFQYSLTVPVGITSISLSAQAIDFGDNIGNSPETIVNIIPNPPPTVVITSPADTVIEGDTITLSADATDETAVSSVVFTVNGKPQLPATTAPYSISYTVPSAITLLTVVATVTDNLGKQSSDQRVINVVPDPRTTVIGRVVDANGNAAAGVVATTFGNSFGLTQEDGSFRIANVPSVLGDIRVTARRLTGNTLLAGSATFAPARGGNTDVGTISLQPQTGLMVEFFDPPDVLQAVATGFAGLTPEQFTVTTETSTATVYRYLSPTVNFPDTDFDVDAFYNVGPDGEIDPGSSATAPHGDDISIEPPGGNETFGAQFRGYLYLPSGGDVKFTVGFDDAFELIVNGTSLTRFIGGTDFVNFIGTAPGLPAGLVPIILNYGELSVEADIVLSASGGGLPGGVLATGFLVPDPETTVVGRVLDESGQAISGATVTLLDSFTTISRFDGSFSIIGVPTLQGSFDVSASGRLGNKIFGAMSQNFAPVLGGITDVGVITVLPQIAWAYVSNGGDDTVSIVSPETLQIIATVPVGHAPAASAATPDGSRVYVVNRAANTVSVIDTTADSVIATVAVGNQPTQIVLSRDGRLAYIANSASSSISVLNTESNTVIETLPTPSSPSGLALHPTRDELWIGFNALGTVIEVLSLPNHSVAATLISTSRLYASGGFAFRRDGSEAFGVESCGDCGRFHRLSGNISAGTITILQQDIGPDGGGAALGAAFNPVSGRAYLAKNPSSAGNYRVVEFGTQRTVFFTAPPGSPTVTPDGKFLLVANQAAQGFVSIVDTETFTVVGTVRVGAFPSSITLWKP